MSNEASDQFRCQSEDRKVLLSSTLNSSVMNMKIVLTYVFLV